MPPNSIAYEIREKASKSSHLRFTGIVMVPPGQLSNSIWANLKAYYDGNTAYMKGLHDQAEVKTSWDGLAGGVRDGIISTENMFQQCLDKLKKREMFMPEEVRDIVFKPEKKLESSTKLLEDPRDVEKEARENGEKCLGEGDVRHQIAANLVQPSVGKEGPDAVDIIKQFENHESGGKDMLVWCLFNENGEVSNTYTYNDKAVLEMKQILRNNPGATAAEFYLENGMKMIPLLHSENELLRQKVGDLQNNLLNTQEMLRKVTTDRDTRASEAMAFGTREIKEMSVIKSRKDVAEATVESLREEVDTLKKSSNCLEAIEELDKKMKGLSVKVDSLDEKATDTAATIQKTSQTVGRIVNMIGTVKEQKGKMCTPVGIKMEAVEGKFMIIAKEQFFRDARQLRSLNTDMEKMTSRLKLDKFVMEGEGPEVADSLYAKKGNKGGEGKFFTILVVDGTDKISYVDEQKPKITDVTEQKLSKLQVLKLKSAAVIYATALQDDVNVGEILIVVGPASKNSEARDVEARNILWEALMEAMADTDATFLNMNNLAKSIGEETGETWTENGKWSALGMSNFFSQMAWWAEDPRNRKAKIEIIEGNVCKECGFRHEENDCFKDDIEEAKIKEVESKKDARDAEVDKGDKRERSRERNNPYARRYCKTCTGFHGGKCYYEDPDYRPPNNRKHYRTKEENQPHSSGRGDKAQKLEK